jgi:hypothetical protein
MFTKCRPIPLAAGAILAVAIISCGDDSSPTRPSGTSTTPPPAGPATVTRVDTVIPTSLEPGASARATANATMSDGSVRDVTGEAVWSSTNTRVVRASSGGALAATDRGEAIVTARFANRSSTGRIFVLPAGTFRLTGVISEAGEPLNTVRVEVIAGTGQGLTAITNPDGQFALYGVAGHVRLHAKKDNFVNGTADVEVTDHQSVNVDMRFDGERPRLDGVYALEIAADGCSGRLPSEALRRTYVATVTQNGSKLHVDLSGADFILAAGKGNSFDGGFDGNRVVFSLLSGWFYYYYYFYSPYPIGNFDISERLSSTTAFRVTGTVSGSGNGAAISGLLNGFIAVTPPTMTSSAGVTVCYSARHRFELRRQS